MKKNLIDIMDAAHDFVMDVLKRITVVVVLVIILVTTPIWFIPYAIYRRMR